MIYVTDGETETKTPSVMEVVRAQRKQIPYKDSTMKNKICIIHYLMSKPYTFHSISIFVLVEWKLSVADSSGYVFCSLVLCPNCILFYFRQNNL